ncbi:MAG: glycosyltransferase family 4 protein [Planctomycetota bacterium]|nr:glycosyltransferase family 4 protein [Planctomycetota bacterium]
MNIWLVNHYAVSPSQAGGTRHYTLSKELADRGHRVLIIASSVDYISRKECHLLPGENSKLEEREGVSFFWLRTPAYATNWVRLLNMLTFSVRLWTTSNQNVLIKPDIIIGSSPHLFAAYSAGLLAGRLQIPFVLEVRDLWPQSLIDLGNLSANHPFIILLENIESWLYRRADRIISLLPGAAEHICAKGAQADSILWLPNGIDSGAVPESMPMRESCPFRIAYTGAHGIANGLDNVIDAAEMLKRDGLGDRVHFLFVGEGTEKARLQKRAVECGLNCVTFRDPVGKNDVYEIIQDSDACLMVLRDSPVFKWGVSPNKLFDYMACGRPVLFGVNTPLNPVKACDCGISFVADEPEAMVAAIKLLMSMPLEKRWQMGLRGRDYVLDCHNHKKLAVQLEEILFDVTGTTNA